MTENMRSPGSDVINVLIPINIEEVSPLRPVHHDRRPPYRPEGSGRAIDSTGNRFLRTKEVVLALPLGETHEIRLSASE